MLLFLNNDVTVIDRAWLKEMIVHAVRPGIGAVGARLLYPDDTIQHAGVVLGIGGVAGHFHCRASCHDPGYFGRLILTQETSCVTAACVAVPKAVFARVGGFDEGISPWPSTMWTCASESGKPVTGSSGHPMRGAVSRGVENPPVRSRCSEDRQIPPGRQIRSAAVGTADCRRPFLQPQPFA